MNSTGPTALADRPATPSPRTVGRPTTIVAKSHSGVFSQAPMTRTTAAQRPTTVQRTEARTIATMLTVGITKPARQVPAAKTLNALTEFCGSQ